MLNNLQKKISSSLDPIGWGPAVASVAGRAAKNPRAIAEATTEYANRLAHIPAAATRVWNASEPQAPVPPDPKDRRFADAAWKENPAYFSLLQSYLATREYVEELVDAGEGDALADAKARQFANLMFDALAPSNFLINPGVLVRALDTGGASLVRGAKFAVDDLVHRKGIPLKVDREAFTLGENMAATPGKVVFRNDLIEVIQYAPQTEKVHEIPILAAPPWINKYYILDLAPGRSLAEWAIQRNRTVFMISYRNPDETMQDITMDDYYRLGIATALDVVEEITGASRIEVLSICLGGAVAAMAAAKMGAIGDKRISAFTMLNTLLDYSEVGELALLTDPATLDKVEFRMSRQGFLSGSEMGGTFDMIRAKDLIFNYWVSRWMKGEKPAAFDILAWNEDSTRMPAAMHSHYLRTLYGRNELAEKKYELDGSTLDLSDVTCDTYIVGAINDHIVPWTSSYKAVNLLGGDVRYVLTSGGHVAGAVNPPNPKAWFEAVGAPDDEPVALPSDPKSWHEKATRHTAASWWEDWTVWSTKRAGSLVAPPSMGSKEHPVLGDAPGTYVFS
ncbi:alpha/beta fold hydrolase [Rhodococcus sp. HNM0563]|uniref:PHA/PHB synthase family protein n=1 Tax=unclassified Rhodococcus (in: high G+C Gram-positive bacteria) TaxID=192944 RepID=UPI00146A7AB8|nr:alpha/beta fold hydrolase [Rhodococcus sp. F64268]MCK0092829.1 alpha/beta fold hydrolase [Rhodococcus sp. F64268]NLU61272.1 alpha/beta fold hydrolase [Rhodococcus sp. HNM0563]